LSREERKGQKGDSPSDREGRKASRNRGKGSSSGLIAINNGLIASNKLGEKLVGLGHVGTYMENHEAKQEQKESEREEKKSMTSAKKKKKKKFTQHHDAAE